MEKLSEKVDDIWEAKLKEQRKREEQSRDLLERWYGRRVRDPNCIRTMDD